jgi:L,D-peptidoglycan transpeptidase YkuD (ErfK/YbiS/YcfS/YnhG family)
MNPQVILVSKAPGRTARGIFQLGDWRLGCALGRAGITHRKREGDGATPAGTLRPRLVLFRPDRVHRPDTELPARPIRPDDGWCDDPQDRNYNRAITLPYPGRHERLWRNEGLYDLLVVLDWNLEPAIRNFGSAIFLHLEKPDGGPTEGCIAIGIAAMFRLLRRMNDATRIEVA